MCKRDIVWQNSIGMKRLCVLTARAIEIAPNYGEAHAYVGLTYHDVGRYREALESLNRAIRMQPSLTDDPYWLHMLGLASGHAERWEQSLAAFTKLTESNASNGGAWHGLGWALANLNRDSEALAPLQRGIRLEPQNASAHHDLGNSYFKLQRFNEAAEQFQEYIRLKPNDPAGHHSLGMSYCGLGEFALAVEPFRRALSLGPEFAEVYVTLGQVYGATGTKGKSGACRPRRPAIGPQ